MFFSSLRFSLRCERGEAERFACSSDGRRRYDTELASATRRMQINFAPRCLVKGRIKETDRAVGRPPAAEGLGSAVNGRGTVE
jgi:hypothetical protein